MSRGSFTPRAVHLACLVFSQFSLASALFQPLFKFIRSGFLNREPASELLPFRYPFSFLHLLFFHRRSSLSFTMPRLITYSKKGKKTVIYSQPPQAALSLSSAQQKKNEKEYVVKHILAVRIGQGPVRHPIHPSFFGSEICFTNKRTYC